NDICVNDRKLGGILTETVETVDGMAAIVGIGINLQQASLTADLSSIATSIEAITGANPDGELILIELIKTIGQRYEALQSESGAEQTIREWCAKSSYAFDRKVRVTLNNESFEGTTRGLESDGALRVETGEGELKIVRAGDVTALRAMTDRKS